MADIDIRVTSLLKNQDISTSTIGLRGYPQVHSWEHPLCPDRSSPKAGLLHLSPRP